MRSKYVLGCRCQECTVANTTYQANRSVERKQLLASGAVRKPHGQVSTYANWGCRCAKCTTAQKESCRRYYVDRSQGKPRDEWVVE